MCIYTVFPHVQVKNLVPLAPTGEYVLRKFTGQLLEPFSSNTAYTTLKARCDMDTDGGGWIVIQRRVPNGTVNFTRSWEDYDNGFGDLSGEFWYGLRNIHLLTARDEVELRIDMVKSDGGSLTWTYQTFTVAGGGDKYRLTIGGGEGVGRDAMAIQNGMQFTTYDQDNDRYGTNCAYRNQAGWWYNSCYLANLNGPHDTPSWAGVSQEYAKITWNDGSAYQQLSSVEMKIRVKNCVQETQEC